MIGPYINTELHTTVALLPNQMNNSLYINLKKNLEKKILNKCYRTYGCIMEIYEITKYTNGIIEAENFMASAKFDISFSCRLCLPLTSKKIICKINQINKLLITAENGPILVIITNERVNNNVFFADKNNNLRYKIKDETKQLLAGDFIVITVNRIRFNHGDRKIKSIGFLDNIASEEEKNMFYEQLYDKSSNAINIDKYKNSI